MNVLSSGKSLYAMNRRSLVKASVATVMASQIVTQGTSAANAQDGRSFTYAYKADVQTMDPHLTTDTTSQVAHFQLYEPLVKMGRDGQFEGLLAESWENIDDLTWRFHLREGVTFHNGEPFTADAVVFSLDRIRKPELDSPSASGLSPIEKITKVDDLTVDVVTLEPYAALLSILYGGLSILPPKYLEEVGDDGFLENPVGTGPFTFIEWVKDVELRMEAYQDHWRGVPAIQELIYRPIPEDSARIAALQNGEVDWVAAFNVERVSEFEGGDQFQIGSRPGQGVYAQMDTIDTEPFKSREVRQAVNHAVDVASIIDNLLDGRATRLPSVFFSSTPGFDPDMEPYTYDPDVASQLLSDAGYGDGFESGSMSRQPNNQPRSSRKLPRRSSRTFPRLASPQSWRFWIPVSIASDITIQNSSSSCFPGARHMNLVDT